MRQTVPNAHFLMFMGEKRSYTKNCEHIKFSDLFSKNKLIRFYLL